MNASTLAAIASAVASVGDLWRSVPAHARYDLRQDLGQELALKLHSGKLTVNGLQVAAKHWLLDELRNVSRARETEAEYVAGAPRRYKHGDVWSPTWYAPHPDAEEFAPFACKEARLMHCKAAGRSVGGFEDAMVDFFDSES